MKQRIPWWFILINVAAALLLMALSTPAAQALSDAAAPVDFGWLFPVYAVASAALAVASYAQRRTVAWILTALMLVAAAMLLILSNYGH